MRELIIRCLLVSPNGVTAYGIKNVIGSTPQNISYHLSRLTSEGYVKFEKYPYRNHFKKVYKLTSEGKQLAQLIERIRDA